MTKNNTHIFFDRKNMVTKEIHVRKKSQSPEVLILLHSQMI